ncbi:peptidoglycan DD-metalloendopeptidase family protein [Massilia terrae]|uniref:Peptidoglycan DD-metalloendopeptidase family protein n=1 Tax=Massilia terrae TaxID=1811224 RepID=A0ABT2CTA9_9BURK|nr:peptidoglycan DD-metalloendopeptidase family protein [Massilia terrae]MCS0656450.1 peptidoglycan DD-metalloendopeptidase family protein [Massilia terrae]
MTYTPRLALLTMTLGLLAACSSPSRQAPVIDRPMPKANHNKPATPATPAPVVVAEEPRQEANGSYTVRKGDTLLRIALDHGQSYRDIVTWNNLSDPDDIKVGQVLRVSPPERVAGTTPVTVPKIEPIGPKKPAPATPPKGKEVAEAAKPEPKTEAAASGPAPGIVVTATDDERLSWMWPASGKIVATFDDSKKGIDIAGKPGQQVVAAGAGKVMYAGSGIRGYGNLVIVKHSNTLLSAYAHNKVIVVKEGDTVSKGQVIAEMGDTDADSVKLHFEIRLQGKPVDPARFLPSR